MKEEVVVKKVEASLNAANRVCFNIHGSKYSQNGTPDILTLDKRAKFLGIECKVPGSVAAINQLRKLLQIIDSGGRAILATDDFDLKQVDYELVPILFIEEHEDEFSERLMTNQFFSTTELKRQKS